MPVFYTLFIPGAAQMSCPDGTRKHDMVLTAVPGTPGYNAKVRLISCFPASTGSTAGELYKSQRQVEDAIRAGKLTCNPPRVVLAPVVG